MVMKHKEYGIAIKDVFAFIDSTTGDDETKYLQRAREYIFSSNRKLSNFKVMNPSENLTSSTGKKTSKFLDSDFVYFLDKVFPETSITQNNLLINSDGKSYSLSPDDIRKSEMPILSISY